MTSDTFLDILYKETVKLSLCLRQCCHRVVILFEYGFRGVYVLLFQYCVQRLMSSIVDHEYWKSILVGEQCSFGHSVFLSIITFIWFCNITDSWHFMY